MWSAMASSRSALALISICILVSLSGLGDCRVPLQREQYVREKEQSEHLLLPSEKEEFNEISREIQPLNVPLERVDLRGNDGIFHGERSKGFRFGRPGGCHHGKFNRRGQRKSEHMPFPLEFLDLQTESRGFHPRMDRPLPEERHFDPGFPKREWRHPEEEKRGKENEHMPFPPRGWLEFLLHPFPINDHPAGRDFHQRMDRSLPEKRHFDPGFPKGEWRHPGGEKRGEENEHMPFPARGGWLEFFFHPFLRHDDRPEFHPREGELRPEFGHGFSRGDEFHPREGEFRREFGHGFPRGDEFRPREGEFRREFGHGFPRGDEFRPREGEFRRESGHDFPRGDEFRPREGEFRRKSGHDFPNGREGRQHRDEAGDNEHMPFAPRGWLEFFFHPFLRHDDRPEFHPREGEFIPEFGHGFPRADEFHPRVDEFRPEFGHGFPRMDKFHPRADEFRPEFGHGFPNGGERRQHRDETGDNEQMPFPEEQEESFPHAFPVQPESKEFHSRVEEFMPLPREREFEHGFPGREGRQPGHRHRHGHGGEEKENEDMAFQTEFPVQAESTEFRSGAEEFLRLPRERDFEHNFPGEDEQHRGPFKTE